MKKTCETTTKLGRKPVDDPRHQRIHRLDLRISLADRERINSQAERANLRPAAWMRQRLGLSPTRYGDTECPGT